MTSLILTGGVTRRGTKIDIEIRDGVIDRIVPAGEGDPTAFAIDRRYDADGQFVTSPLVDPHTHLITANTFASLLQQGYEMPDPNKFGVGWEMYEALHEHELLEPDTIVERASDQLKWMVANGITCVRTHVDTSAKYDHKLVKAILKLRDLFEGVIDVQIVGLPLESIVTDEANLESLQEALELGVDVVGGIPHKEATRDAGVTHLNAILDLAEQYDCPVDPHIDETDDPNSRFTGVLAHQVEKRGIDQQVTASHLTAMHSYPNAYADKLGALLAKNDIAVVTNPTTNAELQGRRDDYPRRRGHTRIDELREAGVTVGIGQDNMIDKYHPYGDCDPLSEALFLAHFAHMTSWYDVSDLWDMLIAGNASIVGAEDYGLQEAKEGSFVVYDAPDPYNALRRRAPRALVVRDGIPVARRESGRQLVRIDDAWEPLSFDVDIDWTSPDALR